MPFSGRELRHRGGGATELNHITQQKSTNGTALKEQQNRTSTRLLLLSIIVIGVLFLAAPCLLLRNNTSVARAASASLSHHLRPNNPSKPILPDIEMTEGRSIQSEKDMKLLETSLQASEFKLPHHVMEPGEVAPLVWKSNGKQVDKYARLIGLPSELTEEIYHFCKQSGLLNAFRDVLYAEDAQHGPKESRILDGIQTRGKWATTSPGNDSNWANSNMHWFDGVNEAAFEETLQVLKRGGFDVVLEAIGNEFQSDGLMIAAMGFIVISHSKGARRHADDPGVQDRFFDLLFPLVLPEMDASQLYIGDEHNNKRMAPYNFTKNVAVLMSGDTDHKTGDCDYREKKEMRVAVTIYIADLNEEIAKVVAGDGTALFPVPGNTEWLMKQKGRSWGGGNSLEHDMGRLPYTAKDSNEKWCTAQTQAGKCDSDPWRVRQRCQKSCGTFIEDDRYYSEVIGASDS